MEAIVGRPMLVPQRVENRDPVVVGKITPGDNFREVMMRGMNFGAGQKELKPVRELVVEKGFNSRAVVHDF